LAPGQCVADPADGSRLVLASKRNRRREQRALAFHRISALITHRDSHNGVALPQDELFLPCTQMDCPVPCMRFPVGLRGRPNRGRANRGHAALDGRRACRCAAAARYARIRCLDGRPRRGSGEAQNRSSQDRSAQIARPLAGSGRGRPLPELSFQASERLPLARTSADFGADR
jgi:hypothetical protein